MAYDRDLAERVRQVLTRRPGIEERAMFGGLAFMAHGHMCCGLVKDKLMVRVDPDAYDRLLRAAGARPMDFTGKPMRGFLYVTGEAIATPAGLRTWVKRALDYADGRPPKAGRRPAKSALKPAGAQPPPARRSRSGRNSATKPLAARRGRR
jgi:TfoX/Sxy family transcriptional regulator of competence genes